MKKDEYNPYKIVHHMDKIEQLRKGEQTVPLQLQLIPMNLCNHNCSFCAYRMDGYLSNQKFSERDELTYEKIVEILNDAVDMGVKAIQYTGGGEPTVHRKHKQFFQDTLDRNLDLALVTNGMNLSEETCDILGDAQWVRVSVDSSNAKTYSSVREIPEKSFARTMNNIKTLVKYKRSNIVGVGFVADKPNYKEIYDACKMAKDLGVDNFRISGIFTTEGYDYIKNFEEVGMELAQKAKDDFEDENFTVFNLFTDRVKDSFEGVQDYDYCGTKELMAYIGADYNVYTCCTLAYNLKGRIGSIKEQSFKELWEGEQKKKFYAKHKACNICTFPCIYKEKNEFINYMIKKDPKHTNFI